MAESESKSSNEKGNDHVMEEQELSLSARYAYVNLCVLLMNGLYPNDLEWCSWMLDRLCNHLALSTPAHNAMIALLEERKNDSAMTKPLINILSEEITSKEKLIFVPQDLTTLSLKEGHYDARARVLIKQLTAVLSIPWYYMEYFESNTIQKIEEYIEAEEEKKKRLVRKENDQKRKYLVMGLATLGSGLAVAFTGGLAAPLIAAGASAIVGTSSAAVIGSTVGVAIISSLFGVTGAGLTNYRLQRKYGELRQFEFEMLTVGKQPHFTIAISGWLLSGSEDDFRVPWATLYCSKEQYTLKWETEYLAALGSCLRNLLYNNVLSEASLEVIKQTALAGIVSAVALPAIILKALSVIDNPWSVCCSRAVQAGKHLAEILCTRRGGSRPVTLIGFSLGARVIYYCLEEMKNYKDCMGIIENVVLLGGPVSGAAEDWEGLTDLVSGKIINGYCRTDWILHIIYRTSNTKLTIAGLYPIKCLNDKIVNINLSDHVSGHLDYAEKMEHVLELVGIRTVKQYHEEQIELEKMLHCTSHEFFSTDATIKEVDNNNSANRNLISEMKGDSDIALHDPLSISTNQASNIPVLETLKESPKETLQGNTDETFANASKSVPEDSKRDSCDNSHKETTTVPIMQQQLHGAESDIEIDCLNRLNEISVKEPTR